MQKKLIYIISILSCLLLYFVEQHLGVSYLVKSSIKITLFIIIPLIYIYKVKNQTLRKALNIEKFSLKQFSAGTALGIGAFLVLLVAYFFLQGQINLDKIMVELKENVNVTKSTFVFIAFYITFINSLMEEFFFRGFIFMNLFEKGDKTAAYIFSALLFSLYHIAMFKTWFNPLITALALLGLFVTGLIFNWLSVKSKNFINPWIVHIFGDAAIMVIGFKMFGIL